MRTSVTDMIINAQIKKEKAIADKQTGKMTLE